MTEKLGSFVRHKTVVAVLIVFTQFCIPSLSPLAQGGDDHSKKAPDLTVEEISEVLTLAYHVYLGKPDPEGNGRARLTGAVLAGELSLWDAVKKIEESRGAAQFRRETGRGAGSWFDKSAPETVIREAYRVILGRKDGGDSDPDRQGWIDLVKSGKLSIDRAVEDINNVAAIRHAYRIFLRRKDEGDADAVNRLRWIDDVNTGRSTLNDALEAIWRSPEARKYRSESRQAKGLKDAHPFGDKPDHCDVLKVGHHADVLHHMIHVAKPVANVAKGLLEAYGLRSKKAVIASAPHHPKLAQGARSAGQVMMAISAWDTLNQQADHHHSRFMSRAEFDEELIKLERLLNRIGRDVVTDGGVVVQRKTLVQGLKELRTALENEKPSAALRAEDVAANSFPTALFSHNDSAIADHSAAVLYHELAMEMRALSTQLEPIAVRDAKRCDAAFIKDAYADLLDNLYCVVTFRCGSESTNGIGFEKRSDDRMLEIPAPVLIKPGDDPVTVYKNLPRECVPRTTFSVKTLMEASALFRDKAEKPLWLRAVLKAQEECGGQLEFVTLPSDGSVSPATFKAKANLFRLGESSWAYGTRAERLNAKQTFDRLRYGARPGLDTHGGSFIVPK